MDIAHLCLATFPLGWHLVTVAFLNLSRRPHVVSGARNVSGLAFAVAGFMIVGPVDMLLPYDTVHHYGPFLWPMLISFYGLCLMLYLLTARPRLVVYNCDKEVVHKALASLAARLDSSAQWAGDSLHLPQLGLQLHMDEFRSFRNVSLVSVGDEQSYLGWRKLHSQLAAELRQLEVRPTLYGGLLMVVGLVLLAYPLTLAALHREMVAQQIMDLLRLS